MLLGAGVAVGKEKILPNSQVITFCLKKPEIKSLLLEQHDYKFLRSGCFLTVRRKIGHDRSRHSSKFPKFCMFAHTDALGLRVTSALSER